MRPARALLSYCAALGCCCIWTILWALHLSLLLAVDLSSGRALHKNILGAVGGHCDFGVSCLRRHLSLRCLRADTVLLRALLLMTWGKLNI